MAVETLNSETLDRFKARIERLSPDAKPLFGKMNVLEMMRHMRNVHEAAVGDVTYPNQTNPYLGKLLYYVFCHVVTKWPKGKIGAPDFWTPTPEHEFDEERSRFLGAIEKFVQECEKEPGRIVPNPFFGRLSLAQWARLNGMHLNHHLGQFGAG